MLAQEEYVEVHALKLRGWSISAIARHLGRDRKTVRAYLSRVWRVVWCFAWSGGMRVRGVSTTFGVWGRCGVR